MGGLWMVMVVLAVGAAFLIVRARAAGGGAALEEASGEGPAEQAVPTSLPLATKASFMTASEVRLYRALLGALDGSGYVSFVNVRLNDVFTIEARGKDRYRTLGRLRDKHVDFLIVTAGEYRPVVGLELDGASHSKDVQKYRDSVKDVAFRSAHLPLLRLDASLNHTPDSLRELLLAHCPELKGLPEPVKSGPAPRPLRSGRM